jgi:cardiolipin synthase
MHQRRPPSAAIGWVLFILLVPYAALPIYLIFGTRKLTHKGNATATIDGEPAGKDPNAWLGQLTAALAQPLPAPYRDLRIHADGAEALQALLEVIDHAQNTLDISTFILGNDSVGTTVATRLAARARAGVTVRLLLDGAGRIMGGEAKLSEATRAGVRVGLFAPPWRSPFRGHLNLRNHRKLVVADAGHGAERLWCGGRNLAAEYFEGQPGIAAWHDLSFDLRGLLVRQAADLFQSDWAFAQGAGESQPGAADGHASNLGPAMNPGEAMPAPPGLATAQLIASGPDQADDTVHALLVSAAYESRSRVALVSPYVVLEDALLMALCLAARRGVKIDLLLPAHSNHRLADIARHRSLRALAAAGVRVWLAPQMLHAKAAIVDDVLALAGSANLDGRSLFLNYELMVAFRDAGDVTRFGAWFDRERGSAVPYVPEAPGLWRDLGEGLMLWIGFQI